MMRKVSSFFPAVSKDLHVSLSNVENVKEKEKIKVLAAAKEVSENVKRAKIQIYYGGSKGKDNGLRFSSYGYFEDAGDEDLHC